MKNMKRLLAATLLTLVAANVSADPIRDAVASNDRDAQAKLRDEFRNPQQTLRFFGVKPDMTVVEIWPGNGWYTDILSPLLKDNGKLIAAHFFVDDSTSDYFRRSRENFDNKIKNHAPYQGIAVTAFHPANALDIAPEGSADMVLTFRNIHNWYMSDGTEGLNNAFKAFFKALKPGGVLGVVEHEMPESADDAAMKESGYMKKSVVVNAAKQAGFELAAESDINANSMDNADHPKGVWTLPPRLALEDKEREKYLAIGESNRMTLKFKKPE